MIDADNVLLRLALTKMLFHRIAMGVSSIAGYPRRLVATDKREDAPRIYDAFHMPVQEMIRLGMAQTNIDDTGSIQTFTVAPFARYTFLDWRALSLFADGGIDFSSADGMLSADGSSIMDGRVISCGLFVNPGFSVRLCKQVSLVGRTNMNLFTAGYSEAEMYSDDSDTDTWTLALNPEFSLKRFVDSITLGFVVTF